MNLSDDIKSLVSGCPVDPEKDNVLFCFYLPTEQWEKVWPIEGSLKNVTIFIKTSDNKCKQKLKDTKKLKISFFDHTIFGERTFTLIHNSDSPREWGVIHHFWRPPLL